jgi:hypothetical protein
MARVLVGCERSGVVREAFRELGHDAWSCDLVPADDASPFHLQQDILTVLDGGWDLACHFPPCTHLAVSGARWFSQKQKEQADALEFVRELMRISTRHIPRWALENPVSVISTKICKPSFGDPFQKTTCFWLHNLPALVPSNVVEGREQKCWKMGPSPDRARLRSETYPGLAKAMAEQWGKLI